MKLLQLMKLLFAPDSFVEEATQYHIRLEFEGDERLAAQFPNGELPPDRIRNFRGTNRDFTKQIRRSIRNSLILVVGISLAAGFTSSLVVCHFKPFCVYIIPWTYVLSAVILLWAVLAKVGWGIQTIDGDSLPEKLNEFYFRLLMAIGTYFLLFGLFLGIFQ